MSYTPIYTENDMRLAVQELESDLAAMRAERDAALVDAERLRHFANGIRGERMGAEQGFILPRIKPATNIMQGSIVQHFYAAIDAARKTKEGG